MTLRPSAFLWAALAAVVLFQLGITVAGVAPWWSEGRLLDSDCYMRLQRVLNLYQSGHWYDSFEPRSNAPLGEQLHWTRPLDILLWVGAWAGSLFTDFRSALWGWGMLVSPLMLLGAVGLWWWGTRRIATPAQFLISALLWLIAPSFSSAFMIGRPDHHSLIALCLIGSLACLFRLLSGDERPRLGFYAGLWAGLGIWVSPESLVGEGFVGMVLVAAWIWRGGAGARLVATFTQGMALMLLVALPIEYPPSEWLQVRYARFTLVDVVFGFACALPWTAVAILAERHGASLKRRLGLTAAAAIASVVMVGLTYPRFFLGPTIDYTPEVVAWLGTIGEFQPLWPTSRDGLADFLAYLGPTVIAIGWCLHVLRRGPAERRPIAAALLLGNLIFLPLALSAVRWSVDSGLMAALPWAMTISAAWAWRRTVTWRGRVVPLRALAVAAVVCTSSYASTLIRPAGAAGGAVHGTSRATGSATAPGPDCDWQPISAYLSARWPQGGILFTYLFAGGELIWRTPFGVIGAPYGEASSLADTDGFFLATDDAQAQAILRRRKVDLLLVCPAAGEAKAFATQGPERLHNRLTRGETPSWLEPLALPEELNDRYRLYRLR